MEKLKKMLKPKPKPQEIVRDWERKILRECRNIERLIRDIQREEKTVQKVIIDAVKRNDMDLSKLPESEEESVAKEIVMSIKTVSRLYENNAQLNSISTHLGESVAISRTVGHLSKSAEVMNLVNKLMKVPEIAVTMQAFSKEMTTAGVIEEFVTQGVDSVLDTEDTEEETEEEIEKASAQLPEAVRKEKVKKPTQPAPENEPIAKGDDDDEEDLGRIRARLAKVRS